MTKGVYKRVKPIWNKGKKMSLEYREKCRKRQSGKKLSKKTKLRMSQSQKKNPSITCFKKGTISWNKGLTKETDERVKNQANKRVGTKFTESRRKKMSKSHKGIFLGDKHPNWKGGLTKLNKRIRNSIEMVLWRKAIFERDNYTCQKCKIKGGYLEAHHKIELSKLIKEYNLKDLQNAISCKELWDISNGITLCGKCHIWNRKRENIRDGSYSLQIVDSEEIK